MKPEVFSGDFSVLYKNKFDNMARITLTFVQLDSLSFLQAKRLPNLTELILNNCGITNVDPLSCLV